MSAIGQSGSAAFAAQNAAGQLGAGGAGIAAQNAAGQLGAGGAGIAAQNAAGQLGGDDPGFTAQEAAGQVGSNDAGFNDLGFNDFLKLMINELQNQDPLDPMSNSEMVEQIGMIRDIGATDQLTKTLSSFSSSQELVTASGLIGRTVQGLADDSTEVSGTVDRVTVDTESENGTRSVKVHVDGKTMKVNNIREIETG